jgi:hypothetical protein
MTDLRQAAQAKMNDDDAQGYIADYEAALKIAYEIGFENGKKAQPEQQAEPFSAVSIHATQTAWKMGYEAAKAEMQPEQEPCIGKDPRCPCQDGDACHYKDCVGTKALPVAQPEQEPVAWVEQRAIDWLSSDKRGPTAYVKTALSKRKDGMAITPVYTTPPAAQRTWVGLTNKEIAEILCDDRWQMRPELMLLACQAKLKERNK